MNVIYDISPVGNRPETRTGLARAAWSTAMALRIHLGDHLSFCASGSIAAALQIEDLLALHPELQSAINPITQMPRLVHRLQTSLADHRRRATPAVRPLLDVANILTVNASRSLNVTRTPINPKVLAAAAIYHSSYARIPKQVRRALPNRHVLTVHDLTPLILDRKYFVRGQHAITERVIRSIQREDWVLTVSESTRNDLCNYRPVDPDRIIAIPNAASAELFFPITQPEWIEAVRAKYGVPPGDYILTLHSLAPTKNLPHLARSFVKLLRQERLDALTLVIAGGQEHSVAGLRASLDSSGVNTEQIHFTGYVDDADLAALYSGALAFVFPSLYEGFGLPVLEAMQSGCPVIASNTSSLPEIVGDAGLLVSPSNEDELCAAMLKVYTDSSLRATVSTASRQRASRFSWERTARSTIDVYKKIIASSDVTYSHTST